MNASTTSPITENENQTPLMISIGINFIVCLFIITNNVLLLITLKRTPKLHTPPNAYIASLGVADLLVGFALVVRHFWLIPSTEWVFDQNRYVCLPFTCLLYVSAAESVLTLLWLSVERYLFIVRPFWHARHVTTRWIKWTIATSWILSIVSGCLPLFFNNFTAEKGCNATVIIPANYFIVLIAAIFASAALIAVMYGQIVCVVRRQRKRLSPEVAENSASSNSKTCRFFFLVCFLFYICWLPLLVTMIVHLIHGTSMVAISATISLSALNSALNFIVFVALNRDFRAALKLQLCGNHSVDTFEPQTILGPQTAESGTIIQGNQKNWNHNT